MNKDNENTSISNGLGEIDRLRLRLLQAKSKLPKKLRYVTIYEHDKGLSLDYKQKTSIRQCWNGVLMREEYVSWFEALAEKLKVS